MRRARSIGWKFLLKLLFSHIPDCLRTFWIIIELIVVFIGLCASCTAISQEQSCFNIITFSSLFVSFSLAVVDALCNLKSCRAVRRFCLDCCDEKGSVIQSGFDVFRIILSELLMYPLLICSIFSLAIEKSHEQNNGKMWFHLTLHILSFALFFIYCYIVHAVSLICIARNVRRVFVQNKETFKRLGSKSVIGKSAYWYLTYFIFYAFLQMIVQLLSTVTVGSKIWLENVNTPSGNFSVSDVTFRNNTDQITIHASGYLISTIVISYITPFLGFLYFFVNTYYWSQELPIGLFIDMVSIWKKGSKNDVLQIQDNCQDKLRLVQAMFNKFVQMETLENDFKKFCDVSSFRKFVHPIISPFLIVCCIFYAALLASFSVSAAMGLTIHVSIKSCWVIFYIAVCIIGVIANVFVLFVALIWASAAILVVVLIPLFSCILLTVLCFKHENKKRKFFCSLCIVIGIVSLVLLLLYFFVFRK